MNSAAVALGGLFLALLYEWRRTLLAPVVLHALLNGVSMAAMVWGIAADANAPRLGVRGGPHEAGCLISSVVPGSAADEAGLRVGDVVTALDGERVADIEGMSQVVRRRRVGDQLTVEFVRGGETHRIVVVLKVRQD